MNDIGGGFLSQQGVLDAEAVAVCLLRLLSQPPRDLHSRDRNRFNVERGRGLCGSTVETAVATSHADGLRGGVPTAAGADCDMDDTNELPHDVTTTGVDTIGDVDDTTVAAASIVRVISCLTAMCSAA